MTVLACTPSSFRPASPRRAQDDRLVIDLQRADLRHLVFDVEISGASPAEVEGAWVSQVAAADGAPCARHLAAREIEKVGWSSAGSRLKVHFDSTLLDVLRRPSTLELRVAEENRVHCIALPLTGPDPDLRWTLEPTGRNRPFVGRGIGVWFPVGSHGHSAETDLTLLRLGWWGGPVRLGGGAGFGFTCCARGGRNAAVVIPTALAAEVFPVVAGRFAIGLGASYAIRPSWFGNDSSRGFELVHGPVGSLEFEYLPHSLPGFLEGPKSGTLGLALSVGRWLPNPGATVLAVSLSMN